MPSTCLSESGGEVKVAVRVTPRSPRQSVEPPRGGRLIVRVSAAPADGAANASVRKLVAKSFGIPQSDVRIVRGQASRDKLLALSGIDLSTARRVVSGLSP